MGSIVRRLFLVDVAVGRGRCHRGSRRRGSAGPLGRSAASARRCTPGPPRARAGTPPEALARLEQATATALQSPAVRERLSQIGSEPVPVPGGEFRKYFNDDVERWARLVKEGKVAPLQ